MVNGLSVLTFGLLVGSGITFSHASSDGVEKHSQAVHHSGGKLASRPTNEALQEVVAGLAEKVNAIESLLKTTRVEVEEQQNIQRDLEKELEVTRRGLQTDLNSDETDQLDLLDSQLDREERRVHTVTSGPASVFVHWGLPHCPSGTTLVYSGLAAGKSIHEKGSGSNLLCLVNHPKYTSASSQGGQYYGHIFATEYRWIKDLHNSEIPCSLCKVPLPVTIMLPGSFTCPPRWRPQYSGHITSHYKEQHASEYICLSVKATNATAARKYNSGSMMYYVKAQCGGLKCLPFSNDKVLSCVICSQ